MAISKNELEKIKEKNRHSEKLRILDLSFRIIGLLIRYGAYVFMALCLYFSIDSIAKAIGGHETGIKIALLTFNYKIGYTLSIIISISGIGYGWKQKELKKRTIEHMQFKIKELEIKIDPERSSSGLTPKGETNPEDKI